MTSPARLLRTRLDLATPLVTSQGIIEAREIVFLRVESADGIVGWGEAAPLPGWPGPDLRTTIGALDVWIASGMVNLPTEGPARAAVDGALLDVAAQRAGVSVAALLNPHASSVVKVNALIDALDPEEVEQESAAAVAEGFETIKLKVASGGHDLDRVGAVRRSAPHAALRLDANQGLGHDDAVAFCNAAAEFDIEFIEEPVAGGIAALQAVQAAVGISVAADETLATIDVGEYATLPIETLVVKPSALGHLQMLQRLSHERRLIITSFLDSAVGVTMALHLAAAQPDDRPACGLATSGRFRSDVGPVPSISRGSLKVPAGPGLGVAPQLPAE